MEDPVSMSLKHLSVGVEARIAELGDFLGEELDSIGGVAEDDGLIDLKLVYGTTLVQLGGMKVTLSTYLGEQRVQAMNLLAFLYECIVLGNTSQRQFLHQIDFVRVAHVAVLFMEMSSAHTNTSSQPRITITHPEILNDHGEGS